MIFLSLKFLVSVYKVENLLISCKWFGDFLLPIGLRLIQMGLLGIPLVVLLVMWFVEVVWASILVVFLRILGSLLYMMSSWVSSLLLKRPVKEIIILYGLRMFRLWFVLLFMIVSWCLDLSETGGGNDFGFVKKSLLKFLIFSYKAIIVRQVS